MKGPSVKEAVGGKGGGYFFAEGGTPISRSNTEQEGEKESSFVRVRVVWKGRPKGCSGHSGAVGELISAHFLGEGGRSSQTAS